MGKPEMEWNTDNHGHKLTKWNWEGRATTDCKRKCGRPHLPWRSPMHLQSEIPATTWRRTPVPATPERSHEKQTQPATTHNMTPLYHDGTSCGTLPMQVTTFLLYQPGLPPPATTRLPWPFFFFWIWFWFWTWISRLSGNSQRDSSCAIPFFAFWLLDFAFWLCFLTVWCNLGRWKWEWEYNRNGWMNTTTWFHVWSECRDWWHCDLMNGRWIQEWKTQWRRSWCLAVSAHFTWLVKVTTWPRKLGRRRSRNAGSSDTITKLECYGETSPGRPHCRVVWKSRFPRESARLPCPLRR